MREEFEQLHEIKIKLVAVFFNPKENKYIPKNRLLSACNEPAKFINGAWLVWQHQQAKIDDLEKQLIAQGQNFNDQSQNVRDLEFRNGELQKQLACCREENKALLAVNNSIDRECNHISPNTVVVDYE